MAFEAVITQVGLDKAVAAHLGGVNIEITHVGAGTGKYTPLRTRQSLNAEVVRVPIAGGSNVSATQVHLTALFDTGEFTCNELGFYLADGTLFAVISDPVNTIFYKTAINKITQGFDLTLDAVPAGSVVVNTTGDMNMYFAGELAQLATANISNMTRHIQLEQRLRNGGL